MFSNLSISYGFASFEFDVGYNCSHGTEKTEKH